MYSSIAISISLEGVLYFDFILFLNQISKIVSVTKSKVCLEIFINQVLIIIFIFRATKKKAVRGRGRPGDA